MTKQERLILIKRAIEDAFLDIHELVEMLELTVEDVVYRWPNRLLEMEHKFIIRTEDEDFLTEEEIEEHEWKDEYVLQEEAD